MIHYHDIHGHVNRCWHELPPNTVKQYWMDSPSNPPKSTRCKYTFSLRSSGATVNCLACCSRDFAKSIVCSPHQSLTKKSIAKPGPSALQTSTLFAYLHTQYPVDSSSLGEFPDTFEKSVIGSRYQWLQTPLGLSLNLYLNSSTKAQHCSFSGKMNQTLKL